MPMNPPVGGAQLLWDAALLSPDAPCVTDLDARGGGSTHTYAEVVARVAALGAGIRELGLERGDRVAMLLPNSHAYVDWQLAIWAAGMVSVPLNTRLRAPEYEHMVTDSESRVLVTTSEFASRIDRLQNVSGLRIIDAEAGEMDAVISRIEPLATPEPVALEDTASLMYSSGTTGVPKAIVLTHRSWASVADTAIAILGMRNNEATLHIAPLTHGAGFLFLPTLRVGGHNLLCSSFDPARTAELLAECGVTNLFAVPSMIRMLLDAVGPEWRAPRTLHQLYYAGSPIESETLRDAVVAFGGRLVQSFAQMEAPMFLTVLGQDDHRRAVDEDRLAQSAGRVVDGVELRIVDDAGRTVPPGVPGEVLAKAPQVMAGYWRRERETDLVLAGGWLHTGDIEPFPTWSGRGSARCGVASPE
ncbi:MAG: hypothetical protein EKK42_32890 [Pseudonocardiaceae bacterium]|nr:MAG: hypothetical protein EKK42_32890 [Pseudonocardiaceae bacterium]